MLSNNLSPEFLYYLQGYLDYLKYQRNLSSATLVAYESDLKLFFSFLQREKILDLSKITLVVINQYITEKKDKYQETSLQRKLACIKVFLTFFSKKYSISMPFLDEIKIKNSHKFFPHLMNIDEINAFFKELDQKENLNWDVKVKNRQSQKKNYRDSLILKTFYGLGLRVSELCHLQIDQIDFLDGMVIINGKGNKNRITPILDWLKDKWKIYLKEIRPLFLSTSSIDSGYFFLNLKGGKLSRVGVWKIIKKLFQKMGRNSQFSPHSFRHMYATHLLRNGLDIRIVQELLGHTNINTTQKYTHLVNQDLEETLKSYHPFYR